MVFTKERAHMIIDMNKLADLIEDDKEVERLMESNPDYYKAVLALILFAGPREQ